MKAPKDPQFEITVPSVFPRGAQRKGTWEPILMRIPCSPSYARSARTYPPSYLKKQKLKPVHPGEVPRKEFLEPMELSQNRLALAIGVHPRRIKEIVLEKRGIRADTALRLARFFGTTAEF